MGADADHEGDETFDVYYGPRARPTTPCGRAGSTTRSSSRECSPTTRRPGRSRRAIPSSAGSIPRADVAAVLAAVLADKARRQDARGRQRQDADRARHQAAPGTGELAGSCVGDGASRARLEAAGGRDRPEHRQPGERRHRDVDPDDAGGQLERPLDAADRALEGDQPDHHRQRAQGAPSPPSRASRNQTATAEMPKIAAITECRSTTHRSVSAPLKSKRLTMLALVVAGVRARGGADRPGEDRQLAERDQARGPPRRRGGRSSAGARRARTASTTSARTRRRAAASRG